MLEDRFVAALLAIGAQLAREGARLMAPLGLSQQESVILIRVAEQGELSQRALRSALLLERSNVSKAVARLAAIGLLETRPDPDDRRSVIARVTRSGSKTADECRRIYRKWNLRWLDGIERDRLVAATEVLDEVRENVPDDVRRGGA